MAFPTLTPTSTTSRTILPVTGNTDNVVANLPFGIYAGSADFLSGASDQVAYIYKKLGGDVLDIELTTGSVYAMYEEAVLEYSYIVNVHQAKNILSDVLGDSTGTFDHDGSLKESTLSGSLSGSHVALKYPKFEFSYARRVSNAMSSEVGVGGNITEYSASFTTVANQQDYDLQSIISSSADPTDGDNVGYKGKVGNKRILIKKVYYKTPASMWRFYGYYGGLNVVGNLASYGQYADDSTFEVIPVWHNRLQSMAFESAIYVRNSHYSYEIKGNKLRLFPAPETFTPSKIWFQFTVQTDAWEEDADRTTGADGINNMNTLPFDNIPYKNINAIGKQWIRRFSLSLSKETLGQIRSKFSTIPIPGESVTLNGAELVTQAKEEQEKLREELKTVLDEMTYDKLMQIDSTLVEAANKINQHMPNLIFMG